MPQCNTAITQGLLVSPKIDLFRSSEPSLSLPDVPDFLPQQASSQSKQIYWFVGATILCKSWLPSKCYYLMHALFGCRISHSLAYKDIIHLHFLYKQCLLCAAKTQSPSFPALYAALNDTKQVHLPRKRNLLAAHCKKAKCILCPWMSDLLRFADGADGVIW